MRTKQVIEAQTQLIQFGYWNEEKEEFIPLDDATPEEIEKAAKLFGCNPALIDALNLLTATIVDLISSDLKDIWKKI